MDLSIKTIEEEARRLFDDSVIKKFKWVIIGTVAFILLLLFILIGVAIAKR